MNKRIKGDVKIVIAIVLALVSFFGLSKYASSPKTYEKTIASLDDKKVTATALAVSATAASVAVSAIPSDVATPIANELALLVIPGSEKISSIIQATYDTSIQNVIDSVPEEIEIEEDEEGVFSAIWGKVKGGVTGAVDTVKDTLNNFLEAIAVMIVTTCVIPIVTMLFFIWASKSILGVNINLPEKEQLMLVKKGIQKIKQKDEEVE